MLYVDPIELARFFHTTYEELAPDFSYTIRKASAVPWEEVPAPNRRLMIATARRVITEFLGGQCLGEIVNAEQEEGSSHESTDHSHLI